MYIYIIHICICIRKQRGFLAFPINKTSRFIDLLAFAQEFIVILYFAIFVPSGRLCTEVSVCPGNILKYNCSYSTISL